MLKFSLFCAVCCIFLCNASKNISRRSYQKLLKAALMENYDRITLPAGNMSDAVSVSINPLLFQILEVRWRDPDLQWDPALYGGLDFIMLQRSTIWLPDIVILGKISVSALSDKLSLAKVNSEGTVFYASDQVATVSCLLDVVDFPYDTQNCSIPYSSWIYGADELIPNADQVPDLEFFIENDEWTMRSFTNRSQNFGGSLTVFYDIKITRKPSYYITTFVWPTFLINCLSIIGIFSPFNESGEREEKVTMGLTTLLTMAVILMIIAGDMPKSANGVPLLGLFIMVKMGLSSVASVFSVFVVHLHSNWTNGTPVPQWLLKLTCITTKKRKLFKFSNKSSNGSTKTQPWQNKEHTLCESKGVQTLNSFRNIDEHNMESLREKWSKVASRIDLILMVIFLIANVVVCVCLLAIGNSKLNN